MTNADSHPVLKNAFTLDVVVLGECPCESMQAQRLRLCYFVDCVKVFVRNMPLSGQLYF